MWGEPLYHLVVPCSCIQESQHTYRTTPSYQATCGVTPTEQSFDNFKVLPGNMDAFRYAKALAEGTSNYIWLLIYGGTGNGKSHLCAAMARAFIRRGGSVRLTTATNMLSRLRQAIKTDDMDGSLQEFKDVQLLIIDDFGIEQGTDWEQATIDDLLVTRYEWLRATVVTTNLTLSQLPPRMVSRFKDRAIARIAYNAAPDYRSQKECSL